MGDTAPHGPVMLLLAAFSRHAEALDWAQTRAEQTWGAAEQISARFVFRETDYYAATMGTDLRKTFLAFPPRFDPAHLADWKLLANRWEAEYAALRAGPEPRPLNLDPGYLSLAKLVLASTKDHAHRIYLRNGIYAEITLCFRGGGWQCQPWTYPDYQRADFQSFFADCRESLRGAPRGLDPRGLDQ